MGNSFQEPLSQIYITSRVTYAFATHVQNARSLEYSYSATPVVCKPTSPLRHRGAQILEHMLDGCEYPFPTCHYLAPKVQKSKEQIIRIEMQTIAHSAHDNSGCAQVLTLHYNAASRNTHP